MKPRKKIFLGGIVLLLAALIAAGGSIGLKEYKKRQRRQAEDRSLSWLMHRSMKMPDDASTHEITDYVRHYIYANSAHNIDAEFYAHWGDIPYYARALSAHAADKVAALPHMECSTRTEMTEKILARRFYETRTVVVYRPTEGFPSHTFLEIRNKQSGHWEIQDPDYDIFWRIKEGKRRAGIEDLLTLPPDKIEPCWSEDDCGWNVAGTGHRSVTLLKSYFGLASVRNHNSAQRPLFDNPGRFNLKKPQITDAGGPAQDFCNWRKKDCRDSIISLPEKP